MKGRDLTNGGCNETWCWSSMGFLHEALYGTCSGLQKWLKLRVKPVITLSIHSRRCTRKVSGGERRGKKTGSERTKPEGRWAEWLPSCLLLLQIPLKAKLERSPKVYVSKSQGRSVCSEEKEKPCDSQSVGVHYLYTYYLILLQDIERFIFVALWRKRISSPLNKRVRMKNS